jgi:hypothetical protein
MRVCGVLAPVPSGHRWFRLLSGRQDAAEELHDLLVALSALQQAGVEVSLVAGRRPVPEVVSRVTAAEPDLVVLAASSACWPSAVALAPALAAVSGAPVRLFGGHARRFPQHALQTARGAEQAVVGGVDALVEVVNRARLGQEVRPVAGVWDHSGPAAPRPTYVGPLPPPEWGLLGGEHQLDGVASLLGVRLGSTPGPDGGRPESPEAAGRSLQRAARLKGARGIVALDPNIAHDAGWFAGLMSYLGRHHRPASWSCRLPPPAVTPGVARRLGPAGCSVVTLTAGALGVSGSEGMPSQLAAAAHMLRGHGVRVRSDLVLGAPGSSPASDQEAIRIVRRYVAPSDAWPRLYRPDPGTPTWYADRWTPEDWVTSCLEPARAMYLPQGYSSLGEVEVVWKSSCFRAVTDLPRQLGTPLRAAIRLLPAAPARRGPR